MMLVFTAFSANRYLPTTKEETREMTFSRETKRSSLPVSNLSLRPLNLVFAESYLLISRDFPQDKQTQEAREAKRQRERRKKGRKEGREQNEDNLLTLWPLVAVGLRELQSYREEGNGARGAQSIERGKTFEFSNSLFRTREGRSIKSHEIVMFRNREGGRGSIKNRESESAHFEVLLPYTVLEARQSLRGRSSNIGSTIARCVRKGDTKRRIEKREREREGGEETSEE